MHTITLQAAPGTHYFLFEVDGRKTCSDHIPVDLLGDNFFVNLVEVLAPFNAGEGPVTTTFLVDREAVLEYWLCLPQSERRKLVQDDKKTVLRKLRQHYKQHAHRDLKIVHSEIESQYEEYAKELEGSVVRYFENVELVIDSDHSPAFIEDIACGSTRYTQPALRQVSRTSAFRLPASLGSLTKFITCGATLETPGTLKALVMTPARSLDLPPLLKRTYVRSPMVSSSKPIPRRSRRSQRCWQKTRWNF